MSVLAGVSRWALKKPVKAAAAAAAAAAVKEQQERQWRELLETAW
jgi:hypothetical protein